MFEGTNGLSVRRFAVVTGLLVAASMLFLPAASAQEKSARDQEIEAFARMLEARRQADDRTADADTQPPPPAEDLDAEIKLTGNKVIVDTVGSDTVLLIGNDQDLDALEEFIRQLDREVLPKDLRMHTLANRDGKLLVRCSADIAGSEDTFHRCLELRSNQESCAVEFKGAA